MTRPAGAHEPFLGVVEDSPEDFDTLSRLLRRNGFQGSLKRYPSGEEALAHLRGLRDAGDPTDLPCLLLLDLNLPGCTGCQVAEEIKGDPFLRAIPIVVLSTSAHERDVESCYRAGANGYLQKPVDLERFRELVRALLAFWFDVTVLPCAPHA